MKWMEKNWSAWNSLLLFWPIKVNAFLLLIGVGSITQKLGTSYVNNIKPFQKFHAFILPLLQSNWHQKWSPIVGLFPFQWPKNVHYLCGQCGVQCHVACSSRWTIVADVCQTCNRKFANSCCCAIVIINLKPKKSKLVSVRMVHHQKAVEFIEVWKFLLLNTHHIGNWR